MRRFLKKKMQNAREIFGGIADDFEKKGWSTSIESEKIEDFVAFGDAVPKGRVGGLAATAPLGAKTAAENDSMSAMMGALTGMFGNMSEAFKRLGSGYDSDGTESIDLPLLEEKDLSLKEKDAELRAKDAELKEKDNELERIREKLEKLERQQLNNAQENDVESKPAAAMENESVTAEPAQDTEPKDAFAPTDEDSADIAFREEQTDTEQDATADEAKVETAEEEEDDDDEYDILSFLQRNMEYASKLTVFDRMRSEGQEVAPMRLSDLIVYLDSMAKS